MVDMRSENARLQKENDTLNTVVEKLAKLCEREDLKKEIDRLLDGIRYWSYCMSEGMRATCPEKVEELMDFLISCKIAPYYKPD